MKIKSDISKVLTLALIISGIASVSNAEDLNVRTIKGQNRIQTSIESAKLVDSKTVVIANAYTYADSLSAYNVASKYNAKLILVDNKTDLSKELKEIKPTKAYLIGGQNTLNGKAVASVYENVKDVKRLDGKNRYETNDKTLAESGYDKVGVADGRNYPDALSASGLLKDKNLGLKLVNGSKAYKTDKKVVYTFGGINSVKQDGGKRLAGHSRYNTSEVINNELGKVDTVAITTGENYADALSSINVVNSRSKVSVMLTNKISSNQEGYIKDISNKIIIGGMLPKETMDKIYGRVSEKPKDDTGTTTQ